MTELSQEYLERHPGIDPETGYERSVLRILSASVAQRRAEAGHDAPRIHEWKHDPAHDGWLVNEPTQVSS